MQQTGRIAARNGFSCVVRQTRHELDRIGLGDVERIVAPERR